MKVVSKVRPNLYLYPKSVDDPPPTANHYIPQLSTHLSKRFNVVFASRPRLRLLNILYKIRRLDYIYFNWIEDLPDKPFGYIQIPVVFIILVISKIRGTKIVWFIHNNLSHTKYNKIAKKIVSQLMSVSADYILSHSKGVKTKIPLSRIRFFDHPFDLFSPVHQLSSSYDLLIWGRADRYKGILEFVQFAANSEALSKYRILIAGEFVTNDYYQKVKAAASEKVQIMNRRIPECELIDLFSRSRYLLFTYNSPSVLSSAALCKSLNHGLPVIGPTIGSFGELGKRSLLLCYQQYSDIPQLIDKHENNPSIINQNALHAYMDEYSWPAFAEFIYNVLFDRPPGPAFSGSAQKQLTIEVAIDSDYD